jgi:hypothetical protein
MNIDVSPAPPMMLNMSVDGANLLLSWSGGIGPYQVQTAGDVSAGDWIDFGAPVSGTTFLITPSNTAAFYRIIGQ